ncbi:hypothetical protein YU82_004948, partial [Salmonella enterica subsp. salamae]|nr:hypothetical protein [Salmonella enterica subsp. salamae]
MFQNPLILDGYMYVFKSALMGPAPTPLVGTVGQKSDYNFAEGNVSKGKWVGTGRLPMGDEIATSPAEIDWDGKWYDPDNFVTGTVDHPEVMETLSARAALGLVAAPDTNVNYVAGWRHGTS